MNDVDLKKRGFKTRVDDDDAAGDIDAGPTWAAATAAAAAAAAPPPRRAVFSSASAAARSVMQRRKLNLLANFESGSPYFNFKRLVPGGFNMGFIGSTCTALP
jgi:hypothetical protein